MIFGPPQINKLDYGTVYGSTALKSLQNDNMPELDLLIREAVQNSSDASRKNPESYYQVDFNVGDFISVRLNSELHQVGRELNKRFRPGVHTFLEIRDSKTAGLTGPYRKSEINRHDHGNYFKLIFDTGKKQTQIGAGGNWGFGKSVYYRIGQAGLAFFYTRIKKEDGSFEERLIGTMVENETLENSVLVAIEEKSTGRAWWGRPDVGRNSDDAILPIVDKTAIAKFLDIFNLKPFASDETGTSIIIPYINPDELVSQAIPDLNDESELRRCWWASSIEDYIEYAVQKWYAPKLLNANLKTLKEGGRKMLRARINGKLIRLEDIPFFKLVQELYNSALFACIGQKYSSEKYPNIVTEPIRIQAKRYGLTDGCVGHVSYIRITRRELTGTAHSASPYSLSGNYDNKPEENEPIVMFAREPGMVIDYSINGEWSNGVKSPIKLEEGALDDEYIFAFFVPKVFNAFDSETHPQRAAKYHNLGGYLRDCEGSDHVNWSDNKELTLVKKIKHHVGGKIKEGTKEELENDQTAAPASRLSGKIGKLLMPPISYMDAKAAKSNNSAGSPKGKAKQAKFAITGIFHKPSHIEVSFTLPIQSQTQKTLALEIQSEAGSLAKNQWEEEIGTAFPLELIRADIEVDGMSRGSSLTLEESNPLSEREFFYAFLNIGPDNRPYGVTIESAHNATVTGKLAVKIKDRKYQFNVREVR